MPLRSRVFASFLSLLVLLPPLLSLPASALADELPIVPSVEQQPFVAATERLLEALQFVGAPLSPEDEKAIRTAMKDANAEASIREIQKRLDKHCLVGVNINPESRVKVSEGPAGRELVHNGWRTFLVKVHNEAGITPRLTPESPNAAPLYKRSTGSPSPKAEITPADATQRWLDVAMFDSQPMKPTLSGLGVEYRILQLYSRDVGKREARLGFNVGQGTQDLGFRNAVAILFQSAPAVEVVLGVKDFDGAPTSCAFVFRDKHGRVYPNPARRLAPDFFFHNQIYRADGESVHLPPGEFTVTVSRGPEYLLDTHQLIVKAGAVSQKAEFSLRRWIHAAKRNWYSGDHHVHAAGCAHYENPTEGVTPADMMRHILGEDLNVGCVLSWGPCWYAQKQYFEGKTSALSKPNYLMRYDVEVSGFPSSHAGHLCLLRLKEDDYPGTLSIEQWPSWTLPVLKWGAEQGGVVGYSHSGWGLSLPDLMADGTRQFLEKPYAPTPAGWAGKAADTLPDYAMPKFDGIGANEYIVTTALDTCHFISAVDTPAIWELNIWYHTLNCGMTTRISGETDFPCIYGDKVGLGRIYVKIDEGADVAAAKASPELRGLGETSAEEPEKTGTPAVKALGAKLDFDTWILGVRDGRSYCGDGLSHIFDFQAKANGQSVNVGEPGTKGKLSTLAIDKPGKVQVAFDVAALLEAKPNEETERIRKTRLDQKPYWHLERSRIGETRTVPVEVIVNGVPAAKKVIEADGGTQSLAFDLDIKESSWVAVRILPSVHTNPIWVEVGGKPVRASKRSAQWCIDAVKTCWNSKKDRIRESEREAAKAAYDKASAIYQAILAESTSE